MRMDNLPVTHTHSQPLATKRKAVDKLLCCGNPLRNTTQLTHRFA